MKKRLTPSEEFEIMKLVLDKFLWLGVIIMGLGLYKIAANLSGLAMMMVWAIILIIFLILIVKEYEIIK